MRRNHTIIRVVAAALVAIGTAIGVIVATGVAPASAETPSCGPSCADLFSAASGPGQIIDVQNGKEAVATPIVLDGATNSNYEEDFTVSFQGTVSDFVTAGLVSATLSSQYGNDPGLEFQYSPFGVDSGLCVGVAATATQNEQVSLQPCGVTVKTVWFVDASTSINSSFVPLINGSDTDVSNPFVLTDPMSSGAALTTTNLESIVPKSQMWSVQLGTVPSADTDLAITQPSNVTVDATGPAGAKVTYTLPTVTDPDDTSVPTAANCNPAPGSTFPITTSTPTTVTCTATGPDDTNGSPSGTVSSTFTVTVKGAAAQLVDLKTAVHGVGPGTSLNDKVTQIQSFLASGDVTDACGTLAAFVHQVQAQSGKHIPAGQANTLIASAKQTEAVLAC